MEIEIFSAKPKLFYKVEFWEENKEREPVLVKYLWAYSDLQAKTLLRERGMREARTMGNFLIAHMFARDDITVIAKEVKEQEDPLKTKIKEELGNADVCPKCSGSVENDLCENCGWHRESWLSRANNDMNKGKQSASGEQLELGL